jgi:hypothetical protein
MEDGDWRMSSALETLSSFEMVEFEACPGEQSQIASFGAISSIRVFA